MTKIRFTGFLFLLLALSAPSLSAQTGLFVHDRLTQQRSLYPQERLYVHTDAEDYLQGDRIWLKAYLMDEVYHTPEDSTLYVYAELFDRSGDLVRRVKMLRRQGAFSGYLDIPEDMPSGDAYLRAYSRYMAAAPETAFTKRISVGRTPAQGTVAGHPDGNLSIQRRPHGFRLSYPTKELQYLLVLRGGVINYLGAVSKSRSVTIPDEILPDGPLDFLVVDREGKVLSRQSYTLDRGEDRCRVPLTLDQSLYQGGDSVRMQVDPSALREGEWLDLSVSVTCRPLISRHLPASITDYVLGRSLGFDYGSALQGTARVPAEKEVTSTLSGTVRTTVLGRPVKEARIGLISPEAGMLDVRWSGPDGRFRFEGLDFPAGTRYLVKSTDQEGRERYRLDLDEESFPSFTVPADPYATALDDTLQVVYADDDNPFGTIALETSVVTTTVDGPPPTGFNRNADYSVSLRHIQDRGYTTLEELLREVPGVFIRQVPSDETGILEPRVYLRAAVSINADVPAAIAIDGTILDGMYDLDMIRIPDVARVDIFKTGQTVLWGSKGGGGVVSITTKAGNLDVEILDSGRTVHQKVVPLGYQRASDFQSALAYRNRRTVYWNPQVLSDTVSFRLGDTPGSYLVVLEGVTSEGRLVHEERTFEVYR